MDMSMNVKLGTFEAYLALASYDKVIATWLRC